MVKSKTCCLTGPREDRIASGNEKMIRKELEDKIRKLITYDDVSCFYVGMESGVNQWAAEIVLRLKEEYPAVRLTCVLSCEALADEWTEPQRDHFYDVMERCDEELMLQGAYTADCERKRDEYIIRRSDFVLAIWEGVDISSTGYLLSLARRSGKEIETISPSSYSTEKQEPEMTGQVFST